MMIEIMLSLHVRKKKRLWSDINVHLLTCLKMMDPRYESPAKLVLEKRRSLIISTNFVHVNKGKSWQYSWKSAKIPPIVQSAGNKRIKCLILFSLSWQRNHHSSDS